ncbi:MAG: MBL fold metallo-hydrolase [Patescibacteria group bacterium]
MIDENNSVKVTFHGGAGSVTGVNILVQFPGPKGPRILLDCGLVQGSKIGDKQNHEPFAYDMGSIDALFISHAHIDHTGRIPKLVKDGYRGPIYSTPPTKDIAHYLLLDSVGILTKEARAEGKQPLYEEKDVEPAMSQWKTVEYHQKVQFGELSVELLDAGHVLGSSMIEMTFRGKKFVFTGDLGNSPAPFLRDTEDLSSPDYLFIESVYGDRNHEHRDDRRTKLEDVIEETAHRKGTLVVPAFSFERTQELLFEVKNMIEQSRIPLIPVYLDSPLAIHVTDVYNKYLSYYKEKSQQSHLMGDTMFGFPQLHPTLSTEESKSIAEKAGPKIVIAGSGMSNGGRILHHEKKYLPDPNNTLLMLGYQAPGTMGRLLQEGIKNVRIFGDEVPVRARVVSITGYSAHKDSDHLLEFVERSADSLKKVFVVLGEPKSSLFLVQKIRDNLGVNAVMPHAGETVELPL